MRIWAEAEKGHRDRLLPLTPDFASFLLETPETDRAGVVFKIDGQGGAGMSEKRVCRTISAFGRKAGVVVNKGEGKFASAHDLRRSFGTRWSKRVMPIVLRKLMRHSSIETTLRYYVDQDADELAEGLWKQFGANEEAAANRCDDCRSV